MMCYELRSPAAQKNLKTSFPKRYSRSELNGTILSPNSPDRAQLGTTCLHHASVCCSTPMPKIYPIQKTESKPQLSKHLDKPNLLRFTSLPNIFMVCCELRSPAGQKNLKTSFPKRYSLSELNGSIFSSNSPDRASIPAKV